MVNVYGSFRFDVAEADECGMVLILLPERRREEKSLFRYDEEDDL